MFDINMRYSGLDLAVTKVQFVNFPNFGQIFIGDLTNLRQE